MLCYVTPIARRKGGSPGAFLTVSESDFVSHVHPKWELDIRAGEHGRRSTKVTTVLVAGCARENLIIMVCRC